MCFYLVPHERPILPNYAVTVCVSISPGITNRLS